MELISHSHSLIQLSNVLKDLFNKKKKDDVCVIKTHLSYFILYI